MLEVSDPEVLDPEVVEPDDVDELSGVAPEVDGSLDGAVLEGALLVSAPVESVLLPGADVLGGIVLLSVPLADGLVPYVSCRACSASLAGVEVEVEDELEASAERERGLVPPDCCEQADSVRASTAAETRAALNFIMRGLLHLGRSVERIDEAARKVATRVPARRVLSPSGAGRARGRAVSGRARSGRAVPGRAASGCFRS